jgi:K+-transporting ATPase KdpF subunit
LFGLSDFRILLSTVEVLRSRRWLDMAIHMLLLLVVFLLAYLFYAVINPDQF